MSLSTKPYKGTRDFYPEDMVLRQWMFDKISQVAQSFGYLPYDGPQLESFELYAAKSGEEIVSNQLYWFEDRGGRKVAIRPEMTPTMARMVAAKFNELPKPIRWFSIPNLWRYERPQRGRLREHWQLNVDLLGGDTQLADQEIIKLAYSLIASFNGTEKVKIRINNRRLVNFVFNELIGLSTEEAIKASKAIDARDKMGEEKYSQTLKEIGITAKQFQQLEDFFKASLTDLKEKFDCEGAQDILQLFEQFKGTPVEACIAFDPLIMRGLDYYTGTVFEVFDISPENNRAMFGGGRYDNLVGLFGKNQMSGIGFGMGDVTLQNFLETHGLFPKDLKPAVDAFIITTKKEYYSQAEAFADALREIGLTASTSLSEAKLGQQFKTADKVNARLAIVFGDDEIKNKQVTLKQLSTGDQSTLTIEEAISFCQKQLKPTPP